MEKGQTVEVWDDSKGSKKVRYQMIRASIVNPTIMAIPPKYLITVPSPVADSVITLEVAFPNPFEIAPMSCIMKHFVFHRL